jgi:hypothetical protein
MDERIGAGLSGGWPMRRAAWVVALALAAPGVAAAGTLCCGPNPLTAATLRQDADSARFIVYGYLSNPRLDPSGGGSVTLHIERVLKNDPFLANRQAVELPRYVPVQNPKQPPRFVVFCELVNGKIDPYRGTPAKSPQLVDYLRGAMALDPANREQCLLYYFRYLDHPDPEISKDAFLEFAKSTDRETGQVASKLSPDKLRTWLQDPQTPAERLGLYAFLLGACGGQADADVLRRLVEKPTERTVTYLGGILAGYLELRPREGWDLALAICRDRKRPFQERFAILGMLRFYHGWKPDDTRRDVVRCQAALLDQGDIADLAIEDLRRWQYWELTAEVLALYGRKSHDAPIMRRAILRYALSCPRPEARRFLDELKKSAKERELLADVEESLQFEKTP